MRREVIRLLDGMTRSGDPHLPHVVAVTGGLSRDAAATPREAGIRSEHTAHDVRRNYSAYLCHQVHVGTEDDVGRLVLRDVLRDVLWHDAVVLKCG